MDCQDSRIIAAAFSAIITQAALVLPLVMVGITEASATRRPSMPCTRRVGSTTAAASHPILQVPTGCQPVEAALRMKRKITGLAPSAADQLLRHDWPGNVRELENAMERAVALARGKRVELEDLPEEIRQVIPRPLATRGSVRPLGEIEKEYIIAALELNGGNQTQTARQLKIGSATLYRKLKSYGMIGSKQ